jgi:hypothetical protein
MTRFPGGWNEACFAVGMTTSKDTRTRAKPPEGSRRPGVGSKAPADAGREQADQANSYPGGGSTTGTDHPEQDQEVVSDSRDEATRAHGEREVRPKR